MIIGAMRCGTTSLYTYLTAHPEICPAIVKEPEFFSRRQKHGVIFQLYEDIWNFKPRIHKIALEASTGYSKYPLEDNVPKRIRDYGLNPKLIYIVRNPFERIESHFNYMKKFYNGGSDLRIPEHIDISRYNQQLKNYLEVFPKENLMILDFEDLTSNPTNLLFNIYRFLNVSEDYLPDSFEIRNSVPDTMEGYYRLSQKDKDWIKRELSDDMQRLSENHGINIAKWGFS
jgi:hypothetical protein